MTAHRMCQDKRNSHDPVPNGTSVAAPRNAGGLNRTIDTGHAEQLIGSIRRGPRRRDLRISGRDQRLHLASMLKATRNDLSSYEQHCPVWTGGHGTVP